MCNDIKEIVLADELELESLFDGSPQVYWASQETYGKFIGSTGYRFLAEIFQISAGTELSFIATEGPDGKTWETAPTPVANDDGAAFTSVRAIDHVTFPKQSELRGRYRLGIVVKGDTGAHTQGRVRLTALAKIFGVAPNFKRDVGSAALAAAPADIGVIVGADNYTDSVVYVDAVATDGAATLAASASFDDGATKYAYQTIMVNVPNGKNAYLIKDLPRYTVISVAPTAPGGTITVAVEHFNARVG